MRRERDVRRELETGRQRRRGKNKREEEEGSFFWKSERKKVFVREAKSREEGKLRIPGPGNGYYEVRE